MPKPRVDGKPGGDDRALRRRDLLRHRPAPPPPTPTPPPGDYDILKATRAGMGSYFEVRLPFVLPGAADLAGRALDRIDELEEQLTVYRDTSEISRINASAHLGPVQVEPKLFALLEKAVELGRRTGGAYDVAAGALSAAWGFTRGPRRVPSDSELTDARARSGVERLTLDSKRRTVTFDRPGVVLNLGSIGKGYAIDEAVAVLRGHWFPTGGVVHGGRSSLYALGSPPDEFGGRWEVSVANPLDPEAPVGSFRLRNRGMGTSGAAFQRFEEGGRLYGHIIDPRTGEPPADGPLSVSVVAPTAAEADALSTAFYLIGPELAAKIMRGRPELGALFLVRDESDPNRPRLLTLGLTDADFRPNPASAPNRAPTTTS